MFFIIIFYFLSRIKTWDFFGYSALISIIVFAVSLAKFSIFPFDQMTHNETYILILNFILIFSFTMIYWIESFLNKSFDREGVVIRSVDRKISFKAISNRFLLNENNVDDYVDDYVDNYDVFLDNKKLEDQDYLDKFTITNGQKLNIYTKIKGGREGSFLYYFFGIIIVLLPIIILSLGFIPAFSSMLGIILQKSFRKIFDYLECNLGKKTLVSRFKWLTMSVVQYLILGLMIYVIITILTD